MENKGYKIFKTIVLIFAIIIPLAVAFLMCRYTYKRHLDNYSATYFANIKYDRKGNDNKNYKEQVDGLFKYNTYLYRLYETKEIKYNDESSLATLDIYQVVERTEHESTNSEKTYTYELVYYFLFSNVNYSNIYRLKEASDSATIPDNAYAPDMYLQIRDAQDYNNDDSAQNYTLQEDLFDYLLLDYGCSPSKMNSQYIYGYKISASNFASNKVTVSLHCDENASKVAPNENKSRYAYTQSDSLELDIFYVDLTQEELTSFTEGYNGDALAAGYTNYIFRTYWWWEALISIVLVGILTGVFYIVITYRENNEE